MLRLLILLLALTVGSPKPPPEVPRSQQVRPADAVRSKLVLSTETGVKIASCTDIDDQLSQCVIEKGFTLDDVMNSWYRVFLAARDLNKTK